VNDADFDITNEIQDLSLAANNLTITNNGGATTIDLSGYLDNTDDQTIDQFDLVANILSVSAEADGEAPKTVDLSGYLDNTDSQNIQSLALSGANILTVGISGGASDTIDLSAIDTDTNTTYTAGVGLDLTGTVFSLTNDFGTAIETGEITDGTITGADLNLTDITLADFTNDAGFITSQTDDQNISGSSFAANNLTIGIENGTNETISLAGIAAS
jgi:hypothetical protein